MPSSRMECGCHRLLLALSLLLLASQWKLQRLHSDHQRLEMREDHAQHGWTCLQKELDPEPCWTSAFLGIPTSSFRLYYPQNSLSGFYLKTKTKLMPSGQAFKDHGEARACQVGVRFILSNSITLGLARVQRPQKETWGSSFIFLTQKMRACESPGCRGGPTA